MGWSEHRGVADARRDEHFCVVMARAGLVGEAAGRNSSGCRSGVDRQAIVAAAGVLTKNTALSMKTARRPQAPTIQPQNASRVPPAPEGEGARRSSRTSRPERSTAAGIAPAPPIASQAWFCIGAASGREQDELRWRSRRRLGHSVTPLSLLAEKCRKPAGAQGSSRMAGILLRGTGPSPARVPFRRLFRPKKGSNRAGAPPTSTTTRSVGLQQRQPGTRWPSSGS